MNRAYSNHAGETDLSRFRGIEQRPSSAPGVHGGKCICGTPSLKWLVTVGWICIPCYEQRIVAEFSPKVPQ